MINSVASHLLALPVWLALLVVFVLPALESSVFVGFVFPGEVALVVGGVLASQGKVPLAAVLVVGACGAIIGDSVGYAVGRRYGRRMLEGTLGRVIRHHHFDRSERYLAERGSKAVFFGRFTASLRAVIPGLAGMSRMPYRKFAAANVAGAAAWVTVTVMLGFLGGSSWQHVAHLASRIGLGALALFVLAFAGGWFVRRARRRHGEPVSPAVAWVRTGQRLQSTRAGRWVADRFPVQAAFLGRRLDPSTPAGLPATTLLAAGIVCAWTFGGLTEDVAARDGLASVDLSVHDWVVGHRVGWLDTVMRTVTWGGSNVVLVPALVLVGLLLWRRRRGWRPILLLAAAYAAAVVGHAVTAGAVQRPRPPVADWLATATGWSYPSGHTTQVTAFCGALLLVLWPRSSMVVRTAASLAALVTVALVGASRVYLGVHWMTDVLGGFTLSAAVVCLAGAVSLGRDAGRGVHRDPDVVETGRAT